MTNLIFPAASSYSGQRLAEKGDLYRRPKSIGKAMEFESDDDDDLSSKASSFDENRRQNHSEIEKRRRDKMNSYINELASLIPMCSAMNRKLDKLTVLRMAVQHMKTLQGAGEAYTEVSHKPAYISDEELKHLILKEADGFLFVVGCDRGKILFSSESVKQILNFSQAELIGSSLFDYLHPKDISKVKEQLISSDLSPRERFIDAKTMLPVKAELPQNHSRLCSGARRSFLCRMRTNKTCPSPHMQSEDTNSSKRKRTDRRTYSVIHCSGYIKSWPPAKVGLEEEQEPDSDSCNLSCLVAVGKVLPTPPVFSPVEATVPKSQLEFITRHSVEGKFTFVDQRSSAILGYLPQELLGSSSYEFYHVEDIPNLSALHRKVLQHSERFQTPLYRFRCKNGYYVWLRSVVFSFRNPWTKEVDYIVNTNTVISTLPTESLDKLSIDVMNRNNSATPPPPQNSFLIPGVPGSSKAGVSKIGRQIANEVLDVQKQEADAPANSPLTFSRANNPRASYPSCTESQPGQMSPATASTFPNNLGPGPINGLSAHNPGPANGLTSESPFISSMMEQQVLTSTTTEGSSSDGNDEASMAVIMSLLEADAGLGGPVDFSDLPWPL